jgi:hypothetical protein
MGKLFLIFQERKQCSKPVCECGCVPHISLEIEENAQLTDFQEFPVVQKELSKLVRTGPHDSDKASDISVTNRPA